MGEKLYTGPFYGRHYYGGTAILIKKDLSHFVTNVVTTERFAVIKLSNWLLIDVYMPCAATLNRDFYRAAWNATRS